MSKRALAASALFVFVLHAYAQSAVVQQLREHISAGQYPSAYGLAQSALPELEGEVDFDFYYGLAALYTGNANHAVFAFERVLMEQGSNQRARLELARAYFELADYKAARSQFETVLKAAPPNNVRNRVDLYLRQITQAERRGKRRFSADIGLSVGHDSNINGATDQSNILVPALGQINLDDQSRRLSDAFQEWDTGAGLRWQLNKFDVFDVNARLQYHGNQQYQDFNSTSLSLSAAWGTRLFGGRMQIPLLWQSMLLDAAAYRDTVQSGAQWTLEGGTRSYSAYALAASIQYDTQSSRDVNAYTLGVQTTWNPLRHLQWNGSVYFSDEVAQSEQGEHNGRSYPGVRMQLGYGITSTHSLQWDLSYQQIVYAAEHPVFGQTREETLTQTNLGWQWQRHAWRVKAAVMWLRNDSNLDIYRYDRLQYQTSLSYIWSD